MKTLKISLFCGAVYFFLMAVAHAIGFKIPGLFIYFNVPSHNYQDKIISALSMGWAIFFFTASSTLSKKLIKSVLISGAVALNMLITINLTTSFNAISEEINPNLFHIETTLLAIYWLWVLIWYNKTRKNLSL